MSAKYLELTVDKFIFRVRTGYLYSEAGVWLDYDPARRIARLGLTDFRQQSSGDVAFAELPEVGAQVDLVLYETGYTAEQLAAVPLDAANMSLGCGKPNAMASLKQGETILDIGSVSSTAAVGVDVLSMATQPPAQFLNALAQIVWRADRDALMDPA